MIRQEKTILIVDDEQDILDFVSYNLKKEGYMVYTSNNGIDAIKVAKERRPDLVILDVMMPQMDGIEVCEILRSDLNFTKTIIAFLTSRSEDYSQIAGFEAGADDYITKPIRPRLLLAKIDSLLRRSQLKEATEPVELSGLKIDREKYQIQLFGDTMFLPKKEFELLDLLASRPGKVFKREQILSHVWGDDTFVGERTIDVHIRKLREKIGNNYIRTIKGVGYTFG